MSASPALTDEVEMVTGDKLRGIGRKSADKSSHVSACPIHFMFVHRGLRGEAGVDFL